MARIKAEQLKLVLVDCGQFMTYVRVLGRIATPSKMPILHRTALLEVVQKLQKLVLTATDLEQGAQLEMPCVCYRDERAVVSLEQATVTALERHAELLGNPELGTAALTFGPPGTPGQASLGGIQFGVDGAHPDDWPDKWSHAGLGRESRSDALTVAHGELLEAVRFTRPSLCPDEARFALRYLHLRRQGSNGDSRWLAEATDGHRAAVIGRRGVMARDLLVHPALVRAYQKLAPLVEDGSRGRISVQTFNEDVEDKKAGSALMFARLKGDGIMQLASRTRDFVWSEDGTVDSFPRIENVVPGKKDCLEFSADVAALKLAARAVVDFSRVAKRKKDEPFPAEHAAFLEEDRGNHRVCLHHQPSNHRWPLADSCRLLGLKETETPPLRVAFNPNYLLDAAEAFKLGDRFSAWLEPGGCGPLLLEDELDGRVLVMPIRV